jgi:hypothetical protein
MYHNCFWKVHVKLCFRRCYREYHNPTIYINTTLKVNQKEIGCLIVAIWTSLGWGREAIVGRRSSGR